MTALETFWDRVHCGDPEECWPWLKARNYKGYGTVNKRAYGENTAHRVAYRIAHGPIPAGACVLHSCDNRWCCNPSHLRIGSQRENIQDMDSRGRRGAAKGSAQPKAKFTEAEIVEIRRRVAIGEASRRGLARELGVAHATIKNIVNRRTWKHVA